MTLPAFVEVAVAVPVDGTFTYSVPEGLVLAPGHRVLVPFGRRRLTGYVLGEASGPPEGTQARAVIARLDEAPLVPADLLGLLRWTADYYRHPLGEVIRTALPPGINVHSERRVRLTEAGEAARGDPGLAEETRALLEMVAGRPGGEARLGGRGGVEVRAGERLLTRGWLEATSALAGARVRVREIEVVGPALEAAALEAARAALGRAPAQAAVLEWLVARGAVPMEELRAAFPRARDQVSRLLEHGFVRLTREASGRMPARQDAFAQGGGAPPEPTVAQASALASLIASLGSGFSPFLLEGVTGSGKTEVYLRLIEEAAARGLGALVLVPEIALTPQLVGRFRARFGEAVAVLHSGLSDGERHDEWWRIRKGEARIAVGVRSAVFAPVANLGVIIVDEEHEPSFKQEEGLRYHARDLAVMRTRQGEALVLLGSATPSLESLHNVEQGRYRHLALPERVLSRSLPTVEVVDLRRERPRRAPAETPEVSWVLSDRLVGALSETLAAGRQAILFLNRRGQAPSLICEACGVAERCPNCEVSLTLHRRPSRLLCHYCAYELPARAHCGACGGLLWPLGVGTQSLEAEVLARVPGVRVVRLDRDTTQEKGALARRLADFALHRHDVLVGTQMVTKGHDFPGVTLVGVVLADQGLLVPDFRAAERTFQLLHQVAGRAGRGADPGRVLVQSWRPEHPTLQRAAAGDFAGFARDELAERARGGWPPFHRLLMARVEGLSAGKVEAAAKRLAAAAEAAALGNPELDLEVLGPSPAPLTRLRGRTRWQLLVKAPSARVVRWMAGVLGRPELPPGVTLGLDVDPVSML